MPADSTNKDVAGSATVDYTRTCAALKEKAAEASFHIAETKESTSKRAEQETLMGQCKVAIKRLDRASATYAALIEAITDYLDNKRKDSNAAVMAAMRAAVHIVPACDSTIIPRCEDGEAWFETQDGIDVSRLEGSGFRSILSVMMRAVVLRSNPQYLQTLILDELFSKLSVENSATLSSYLPILAQDMQIISIEQKPEVFANNSHVAYKFFLDGDHTVVQKEDVEYE